MTTVGQPTRQHDYPANSWKVLVPRCPAHTRYTSGCSDCIEYWRCRNRRRRRLMGYGMWQRAQVDSTGTARRLQALAVAGWGLIALAQALPRVRHHEQIARWRRQTNKTIRRDLRDMVADLYEQLWDTEGPEPHAAAIAKNRGWLPFEAWTDATIDDPTALPYSDPEAATYVDELRVKYAMLPPGHPQRVRYVDLVPAEQLALFRRHIGSGGSPRGFLARYRPVPVTDLRRMTLEVCGHEYDR